MKAILYPFMVLAACGLALSIAVHLMALAGVPIPGGKLVWGLHLGIFVVWIPTVITSARATRFANRKDLWKIALAGCPLWMRRALRVLVAYGILNFILFMLSATSPAKGHPPVDAPLSEVRGFSGHWMIFYAAAFAILYSRVHRPELYRERKCPQGHPVSPTARFCPDCGHDFGSETEKA